MLKKKNYSTYFWKAFHTIHIEKMFRIKHVTLIQISTSIGFLLTLGLENVRTVQSSKHFPQIKMNMVTMISLWVNTCTTWWLHILTLSMSITFFKKNHFLLPTFAQVLKSQALTSDFKRANTTWICLEFSSEFNGFNFHFKI